MNKKWDSIIEENISAELEHRIRVTAELELEKNKTRSRNFLKNLIFLAAPLGALSAFLFVVRGAQQKSDAENTSEYAKNTGDLNLLDFVDESEDDIDLIAELDFFEDFEDLEDWDGREEG